MLKCINGNRSRISFGFGGTIMDELELAYLAGIKVGIESLVNGLEAVVEKNGNQLPIEFIKLVAGTTITDVELKLTSVKNGKGLLDVLDLKER